jgi:hypothetical protein
MRLSLPKFITNIRIPMFRFYKLLNLFIFILLFITFTIAIATPPASGYEISLYAAYSNIFWLLLVIIIALGILMIISQVYNDKPSRFWMSGYIAILFANIIILTLPVMRNYLILGRGDVLSHIGYIKEILYTGHFSASNIYPIIHILISFLSIYTGLTPEYLSMIVPIIFTIFYIISVYLLARIISSQRGQIILITAFGCLLLFRNENMFLSPSVQCFDLLPFVFFLLLKIKKTNHSLFSVLTFLIVLFVIPFMHPGEGTIFLIVTFLCYILASWIYQNNNRSLKQIAKYPSLNNTLIFYACFTLFFIWFVWFSYTSIFSGAVKGIWNSLIWGSQNTDFTGYLATLKKVNLSILQFVHLVINMFGQVIIYCLVGLVLTINIFKKYVLNNIRVNLQQLIFIIIFIVFSILLFIALFTNLIWVAYNREMRYVLFAATILNGLGLYSSFHNKNRRMGMVFITIILISASIFGIFNTFPSPFIRDGNSQVTHMEVNGMAWFLTNQYNNILIESLSINQLRFASAVLGVQNIPQNIRYNASPPVHFGYDKNSEYGESFSTDRYFIDSKMSRIFDQNVLPEYESIWSFSPDDYLHLDYTDPSANRVFSNGEFWVYYIRGNGNIS